MPLPNEIDIELLLKEGSVSTIKYQMQEDSLIAQRLIYGALKRANCEVSDFSITKEL